MAHKGSDLNMGFTRFQKRRNGLKTLVSLCERTETTLVIHYSCESFYDTADGHTSRITSIAVRNLANGQTESFSIHKVAEQNHTPTNNIKEQYDAIEKYMLDEYFDYVHSRQGYNYLHWNMRDINYGFAAIEHRYKVLGGNPHRVEDNHKFDLARLLVDIYGRRYIGHPRFQRLVKKNLITDLDFLSGEEEAKAFKSGEYIKLHRSTLRKVDSLTSIFERTIDGTLKTDAKFLDIYGLHPENIAEIIKEHWVFVLLAFFISIAGLILAVWAILK